MSVKKWVFSKVSSDEINELAEEAGISKFKAALLMNREIVTPEDAADFFCEYEEGFEEPYSLVDMEIGVELIRNAIENKDKIFIFGDYDADGVTSTVILYRYLTKQGANVDWVLPHREEGGYGLNRAEVDSLKAAGCSLLITVDNGISAGEEIAYANSIGIKVIVTDHHTPPAELPPAAAVINPHRADCPSIFKDLCGVGVVFKLLAALEENIDAILDEYADIIALGTVADIVPLVGENRRLVLYGLPMLENTANKGLKALLTLMNPSGKVTAQTISYGLAPRINAAGRVGDIGEVVRMLLTEDDEEAAVLAEKINAINLTRQQIEQQIFAEACLMMEQDPKKRYASVPVLWAEGWHAGVIGIVAAKIADRYGKPCVIFSCQGEKSVGSSRSIDGFSVYNAVYACRDLLDKFGGHNQAAGMTMRTEWLPDFEKKINDYADEIGQIPFPTLHVDGFLKLELLNLAVAEEIGELAPFGRQNPIPIFCLKGVVLVKIQPLKNSEHCRLEVSKKGAAATLLYFGQNPAELPFAAGDKLDILITLESREYNGTPGATAAVRDIRRSGFDENNYFNALREFDRYKRTGQIDTALSREQIVEVFRFFKTHPNYQWGCAELAETFKSHIAYIQVMLAIEVLTELGFLSHSSESEAIYFTGRTERVELTHSPTFTQIGIHADREQ